MKKRGMFLMVATVLAGCATDVDVGPDTDWAGVIGIVVLGGDIARRIGQ